MLDKIKQTLRQQNSWTPAIQERLEEFERLCLAEIHSETLRVTLLDYLEDTAPLEFFTAPASSSRRNHPYWQSEAAGILLNTSECCIGIDRKMRMHLSLVDENGNPKAEDRDIIYIATILSDTFKSQDSGKHWKDFAHHREAEKRWREVAARHNIPQPTVDLVGDAIHWHLGRFTPELPSGTDPLQSMSLHARITHELDMDFSNRRLGEVFSRKGVAEEISSPDADAFLQKEFDTSAGYFQHVETKLLDVVRFYTAVVLAIISGIYYIAVSDMFKNAFWVIRTPRAFFIALSSLVLFLIGLFFLGMYTELRVRKIRMLEEMAAIRGHYVDSSKQTGRDIAQRVKMVTNVVKAPPFLRRPSEDWYTVILMSLVNAVAIATAASFFAFVLFPNWIKGTQWGKSAVVFLWVVVCVVLFLRQFRWVTVFCYVLDCERELSYGPSSYGLMAKHSSSFPLFLDRLDWLAAWFEKRNRNDILAILKSRSA